MVRDGETEPVDMAARYRRAEQFCEWNVRPIVRNVTLTPNFTGDGDAFWYERQLEGGGHEIVQVDPARGGARVLEQPPESLPLAAPDRLRSPDGRWDLCRDGGDFILESVDGGARVRLTDDAVELFDYATAPQSSTSWLAGHRAGTPVAPVARWSPDGRRVLTHRLDQRAVPETPLIEMRPDDGHRPKLWTYRMPFVGDELATADLLVFEVDELGGEGPPEAVRLGDAPLLVEFVSPLELGWVWWSSTSDRVWYLREDRGASRLRLCVADASTGAERTVLEESAPDYVEPHPLLPWPSSVRLLPGERQLVWPSERDGWRHLYLYDVESGEPIRQLTGGEWAVREVLAADEEWVWFSACGREAGRDPYLRHVYRVSVEGGEPELLTPEDADHAVTVSPSGAYLIDTCSTIDTAPVTRLRRSDGTLVLELETADLSALFALGWRPPQPFTAAGADGTELHGLLYLPSDFDPEASYPVVDSWYPGPQLIRTPKCFTVDDDSGVDAWPGPWGAQAIAELGFVVVNIDGRGTPLRSREVHHATYGRLEDHAIEDHLAVLDELAASRPWMDLSRLGAQGHSAGAAATVRAMLVRPDRFTVGGGIRGERSAALHRLLGREVPGSVERNRLRAAVEPGVGRPSRGPAADAARRARRQRAPVEHHGHVRRVRAGRQGRRPGDPGWPGPSVLASSLLRATQLGPLGSPPDGATPPRGYSVSPPPTAAASPGW